QGLRRGGCGGRTGEAGWGEPAARGGRGPSLGQHGGAAGVGRFAPILSCAEDRREIRQGQHRRGGRPEIDRRRGPASCEAFENRRFFGLAGSHTLFGYRSRRLATCSTTRKCWRCAPPFSSVSRWC